MILLATIDLPFETVLDLRHLVRVRLQKLVWLNAKRNCNSFKIVNRYISHFTLDMSYERPMKSCFES